ncbi:similar to 2',3'-cyclic-nucleotide 3'-phosphodiesterase [Plenodomus lingam JN3]|uniref:Similar to 2',3'-cyclic-nucleotide 3'-phosphodiesterase n=2 Tax=Leptosphaeria maculans TaxID=5022 RepID=E4ZMM8_LEPMJ|nr:similar to 2',3'-cyclic-nucleotide 3'-phosphodiesterase [Plenodomus lingam JN3]CBX92897.1 similar to 2',3'-cyclic-nucleotide 3'-phosphodiesterase [Plenodomus lingam JN3]
MPGSSLWLLPPPTHPLHTLLPTLISQTSSHFHSPHRFLPHITLTSEISASSYSSDPQAWLDALHLPSTDGVVITFQQLASEDVFVRKLYVQCAKTAGVRDLARVCRQEVEGFGEEEVAKGWAEQQYNPHLSLLYHDCPVVTETELSRVEGMAMQLGVDVHGHGELGGWKGGKVVLVPTDQPIAQWKPIAERHL